MKLHPLVKLSLYKWKARLNGIKWSYPYKKETNLKTLKKGFFITF